MGHATPGVGAGTCHDKCVNGPQSTELTGSSLVSFYEFLDLECQWHFVDSIKGSESLQDQMAESSREF